MWLSSYSVIAVIAQAKLAISIRRRIGMFNSSIGLKDWVGEAEASSMGLSGLPEYGGLCYCYKN